MTEPLTIEVWSDVVCPWCCIGDAQLKQALAEFAHADDVEVTLRSFELDPHAPTEHPESLAVQLAAKYGITPEEIGPLFEDVTERAAALGLDFRFDIARSGNTFDAHRLLHLARVSGQQRALSDRLFRAYFTEGAAIGNPETLQRLAVEAGLDAQRINDVLSSDEFADAVRADEEEARQLQVRGVPFFVIDRRYAVSGAQPAHVLLDALEQAHAARAGAAR